MDHRSFLIQLIVEQEIETYSSGKYNHRDDLRANKMNITNFFSGEASGRLGAQIRIISARQIAAYN